MFKKIGVIVAFALVVLAVGVQNGGLIFSGYAENFEVYLSDNSSGKILSVSADEGKFISGKKGESFKRDKKGFDLKEFLSEFDGEIVFVEEIEGGTSFYAYSPKIKYKKIIGGEKVNLHVFVSENAVTVGSPVIYGSF